MNFQTFPGKNKTPFLLSQVVPKQSIHWIKKLVQNHANDNNIEIFDIAHFTTQVTTNISWDKHFTILTLFTVTDKQIHFN